MQGKSLVSINDLTREEIIAILDMAELYSQQPRQKVLEGHVGRLCSLNHRRVRA